MASHWQKIRAIQTIQLNFEPDRLLSGLRVNETMRKS